jgi:hypothetical protein
MKIFKTKVFARWANKESLSDNDLIEAIKDMDAGGEKASFR